VRVKLNITEGIFPMPVLMVATYNEDGSVHVMNLVDGQRAMLISAEGQYEPFELHYAETCIIPEAAGAYSIQAIDGEPVKAIIACVRN